MIEGLDECAETGHVMLEINAGQYLQGCIKCGEGWFPGV